MDTIEALIHRRSCRKYSDRPVEAEKLTRIIEAGQYAPSGMGRQPVTFVAVTDPAIVERLSQLNAQVMGSNGDPFYGAQTVVVVLVDRNVPTHLEDGSLAMGNLLNAAYALGVDSCWIHRAHEVFDSPEGLELLASWGLPADGSLRVASLLPPVFPSGVVSAAEVRSGDPDADVFGHLAEFGGRAAVEFTVSV